MPAYRDLRDALNDWSSAAIDGRWMLVDGYMGGVRVPEAGLRDLTLTIDEGTFIIGTTEGVIVMHDGPERGDVDLMATSGTNRGQFVPGIFKCTRDALLVCYDLTGLSRPECFDAPAGTRRFVALYRRAEY